MKRFITIISLLLVILISCKTEIKSLVVSICKYDKISNEYKSLTSEDRLISRTFYSPSSKEIETKTEKQKAVVINNGDVFYAHYFLIPNEDESVPIDEIETDYDLIEILGVDTDNNIVTLKAKNRGSTKVSIYSSKHGHGSSIYICIE